jgi:Fe-S-cluster containining protein
MVNAAGLLPLTPLIALQLLVRALASPHRTRLGDTVLIATVAGKRAGSAAAITVKPGEPTGKTIRQRHTQQLTKTHVFVPGQLSWATALPFAEPDGKLSCLQCCIDPLRRVHTFFFNQRWLGNRQMTHDVDEDTLGFFKAQHQAFVDTLSRHSGEVELLPTLLTQAFSSFEVNVAQQTEDCPELDCHKGCATCCTLRVVATAPEVLLVARYIRAVDDSLKQSGVDLLERLAEADTTTRGCDEAERVALRRRCPYIEEGACVIYPVRPLACRSHASYDRHACWEAASGQIDEVPYSEQHMNMRSLIQNAMQSALRDAGYPWATYELNHSLSIALEDEGCEEAWLAGEDVFAPAMVKDVSLTEMARAFDQLHGQAGA